MKDADSVALLQWAAPRLGLRWLGFRNVRGQVCKRIRRRIAELGLADAAAYRERLAADTEEWQALQRLCFVTISRFHRDRNVWEALREAVLPAAAEAALAAGESTLGCWSVGCASGEEPYTLSIVWALALAQRYRELRLRVLATDLDASVLARATRGLYAAATLRELPVEWRNQAFEPAQGQFRLRERFREAVELRRADVRLAVPEERFRVILCRNVVFTYFDERLQQQLLERFVARLAPGGALLVGRGERLPPCAELEAWQLQRGIHRRRAVAAPSPALAPSS